MATYSIEDYQLRLNYGETSFALEVMDDQEEIAASYDLMDTARCVKVSASGSNYVIDHGTVIVENDLPHKHRIGGGNTQTFAESALTGIGIMDLRDMGRSGAMTIVYDLACGEIRLQGADSSYPLWIKPASPDCFTILPNA